MSEPFQNQAYWERRLREHFSLEGVGYLRLGRRFNQWMYRVRGLVFDRMVDRLVIGKGATPSETRVLDIGSGTGFYVDRWLQRGMDVTGVDLTQVAVEQLRSQYPSAQFLQADIGQPLSGPLAEERGRYDVASAFDVLFHIVDDEQYGQAFQNIASLLKPAGWFLWSDNFLHRPTMRVEHQVSRSLDDSVRCLDRAGFEVVERVPMFVLMNYPADARTSLARYAWSALVAPAMLGEWWGNALGALLFPIERRLVERVKESPSTELMVCRKRGV